MDNFNALGHRPRSEPDKVISLKRFPVTTFKVSC